MNDILGETTNINDFLKFFLCESSLDAFKLQKLDEETKVSQINIIISRMIDSVNNKMDVIDTRMIDNSMGSLVKVKDYHIVHEAIKQIKNMASGPHPIDDLIQLEKHILKHTEVYKKAYEDENKIGKWMYQTSVLNLYYGTMLIIANCVNINKEQNSNIYYINIAQDSSRVAMSYTMINIRSMNKLYRENKITEAMNNSYPHLNEEILTVFTGIALGLVSLVFVLYTIRWCVLKFFDIRSYLSGEFEIVSTYLEINSSIVKDQKVSKRQEKLAEKLNTLADAIKVKDITSDKTVKKTIKHEIIPELKSQGIKSIDTQKTVSSVIL
jgi:uncharacterized membrane protein SirB2